MSEKNNNRDKIEDIFRDKLSRENLSSEPWNTPPGSVIESALDQLESGRSNRKLLILPLLFLFLTGFIALWMSSDRATEDYVDVSVEQNENKRNRIESTPELPKLTQELAEDNQHIKPDPDNRNITAKKEIGGAAVNGKRSTDRDNQKTVFDPIESSGKEKISSTDQKSKVYKEQEIGIHASQERRAFSALDTTDKEENTARSKQARTEAVHPEIALPRLPDLYQKSLSISQINLSSPVETNAKSSGWEAQIIAGAEWMRYDARNLPSENGKLSGHNDWQAGYNAQLRLANSFSKNWGMDLSLGFSELENRSHYLMDVQIHDMSIQVDQFGHTHIYMEPEVKTPISEAKMSLDYIMQFANTYNPGPADFQVQILQSLQTVQASTGIFRNFSFQDALQLRIHTGVNYRRIIKAEEEMSVYVWHNDEKMVDQRARRDITSQINNNVFEWYTGLSAQYPIAGGWSVNAQVQSNFGLNKINSIGGQDVRMQTVQLGLGLVRKF